MPTQELDEQEPSEDEELNEDSGDGESEKSIKRKRPSHLIDANQALNLHRDAFNHMKETAANYGRTMVHKKVSVDNKTKEFQEDSPKRGTPIGAVRNFVKELKQQQNSIVQKSRVHNQSSNHDRLPPADMQVKGHSTGSNFYPHNVTSNGVQQKYG